MKEPATFQSRPVTVKAIRWDGSNCAPVFAFLGIAHEPHDNEIDEIYLPGGNRALIGDWIVKTDESGRLMMFKVMRHGKFVRKFEPRFSEY